MNLTTQCLAIAQVQPPYGQPKESKVKLHLEVGECDGVTLVRCQGRITYRTEAAELSERVIAVLPFTHCVVLDLSGVERIDSAGLGALVVLHMRSQASKCAMRLAAPRPQIKELL